MDPLELVRLTALMELTSGHHEVTIGIIDGPVATQHPDLAVEHLHEITGGKGAACSQIDSTACLHGTFVAGILCSKRGFAAPAICPDCTFVIRPIFAEAASGGEQMPSSTPQELAAAIIECMDAGARVISLSLALTQPSSKGERELEEAFNQTARRGVIVVAAAGNYSSVGGSAITRHPWVIPVVAYDIQGRPMDQSNLGSSIGRRGLGALGDRITSLGPHGNSLTLGGTSAAAPFVTGAIALLWSVFLRATAAQIKLAVIQTIPARRHSVVPPLLDAWAAFQFLARHSYPTNVR